MVFLKECTQETFWASEVQHPNYEGSFGMFFIPSIKSEEYPKWTWDYTTRKFVKTKKELLNEQMFNKSMLAEGKRGIFEIITSNLNLARSKVMTGFWFQETVYLAKRMQAKAFKDSGYNEDFIVEYPYVMQYADIAHISMQQAAEDILLKAKFDEELLAKTELLRLKHLGRLKDAKDTNQLTSLREEFIRDSYLNAKI